MADESKEKGVTDLHKQGLIRDQDENVRYDSGQAVLDDYNAGSAYEKDRIELRGIIYFIVGLVLVCGVSFGLMWLMQRAMEDQAAEADVVSPMATTAQENLPPEPRLQAAPGYGVDRMFGEGRENLELRDPQSEYRILYRDWQRLWREGRKDPNTGTVITLPMEEAKNRVVQQGLGKTRPPEQAQQALEDVRQVPSYQSSGRATDIRRQ